VSIHTPRQNMFEADQIIPIKFKDREFRAIIIAP